MEEISVVIIVKNGARTIGQTLASLSKFNEVILYDTGSTDDTALIAQRYPNVKWVTGKFIGFGPTKRRACEYAHHHWILSLDSDEIVNQNLLQALENRELNGQTIYEIKRINFYRQRPIYHCWGDDYLLRLFNRQQTNFNTNLVHEDIERKNLHIERLPGAILHYPYPDISAFIQKADTYSTQFALQQQNKRTSSPLLAITNATYSFFKTYILKRGFLDGSAGLLIAFSHATTNFYKYMKLYELNNELNNK